MIIEGNEQHGKDRIGRLWLLDPREERAGGVRRDLKDNLRSDDMTLLDERDRDVIESKD